MPHCPWSWAVFVHWNVGDNCWAGRGGGPDLSIPVLPSAQVLVSRHFFPGLWSILASVFSLQQGKQFQQKLHTSELRCNFGSELLDQQELKPLLFLTVLAQCFVCKAGSPWGIILFQMLLYTFSPISWAGADYSLSPGPALNTPAGAANK